MAFDPTKPVAGAEIDANELRDQFNALKALNDAQAAQLAALTAQLAPLTPVLARDGGGNWSLAYLQTPPQTWSVWARYEGHPDWFAWNDVAFTDFPLTDADMRPPGAWWQVKIAGENDTGTPCTPFSNIISFGPVPV